MLAFAFRWCFVRRKRPANRGTREYFAGEQDIGEMDLNSAGEPIEVVSPRYAQRRLPKPWCWFHTPLYVRGDDENKEVPVDQREERELHEVRRRIDNEDDYQLFLKSEFAHLPKQVYLGLYQGLYKKPIFIFKDFIGAMTALGMSLREMIAATTLF